MEREEIRGERGCGRECVREREGAGEREVRRERERGGRASLSSSSSSSLLPIFFLLLFLPSSPSSRRQVELGLGARSRRRCRGAAGSRGWSFGRDAAVQRSSRGAEATRGFGGAVKEADPNGEVLYGPRIETAHPIHDQSFYLTSEHKKQLKKEFGIEPWTFVQNLSEAVFIPAGCPHQVRNLKSCIKVALDFVSPENIHECIRLTEEFRVLPPDHRAMEDKLEVKKIALYAMQQVVKDIQDWKSKQGCENEIDEDQLAPSTSHSSAPCQPSPLTLSCADEQL